jgi:hypothetical protein
VGAATWPSQGQLIGIVLGDREHPAVVDDVSVPHHLVLREPVSASAPPEPGSPLLLVWSTPSGQHQLHVALTGTARQPMPLWQLEALGEPETFQRRAYARAADALPALLAQSGRRWPTIIADLGEGGARCVLEDATDLRAGDAVQLHLVLDGQDMLLPAEVLTLEQTPPERVTARLRFGPIGRLGDRLHRRVLEQQRRARSLEQR